MQNLFQNDTHISIFDVRIIFFWIEFRQYILGDYIRTSCLVQEHSCSTKYSFSIGCSFPSWYVDSSVNIIFSWKSINAIFYQKQNAFLVRVMLWSFCNFYIFINLLIFIVDNNLYFVNITNIIGDFKH